MNWHTATLSDLPFFQKCAENNNLIANNYSAINCFLYQKKYQSQISIMEGWIFERYAYCGKFCFSFPHNIDGDNSRIFWALDMLAGEAKDFNLPLVFHNVMLSEKDILCEHFSSIQIEKDEALGDYIYLSENLGNLPGSKYSKKRNHINQFKKKYDDFYFEPLTAENCHFVGSIEDEWLQESLNNSADSSENASDLQVEKEIIYSAVNNFEVFSKVSGMTGGILFINKKPAAFCIASDLSADVVDVHFEKCLSDFARNGGYAVINNEFSKRVSKKYLNREEDLGIEGLRKAKLSYYPEMVLEKFKAIIQV